MLKYSFSLILGSFFSFLMPISATKTDKNRTLNFTSINLLHNLQKNALFILHEKVMPLII